MVVAVWAVAVLAVPVLAVPVLAVAVGGVLLGYGATPIGSNCSGNGRTPSPKKSQALSRAFWLNFAAPLHEEQCLRDHASFRQLNLLCKLWTLKR